LRFSFVPIPPSSENSQIENNDFAVMAYQDVLIGFVKAEGQKKFSKGNMKDDDD
jgi:hypothetical protein